LPSAGGVVKKTYRERVMNPPRRQTAITGHAVYLQYTLTLPGRAELVRRHLGVLNRVFSKLFGDENFVTLLRAESMTTIPVNLKPAIEEHTCGYEIT
jgi:hypothetical protein